MRDDEPAKVLECAQDDNYKHYDVLADRTTGPNFSYAHERATAICGRCPIRIACHADNRGEDWLKGLRRGPDKRPCEHCGEPVVRTFAPKVYCGNACRNRATYERATA
jgi:hypothetical protein